MKNGFFDKRANAAGRGLTHDYESRVIGCDVVVVDHASDLMWQHGGSDGEHVFANAEEYVQTLNRDRLAGFADWRLPTVEEVGSLIEPEQHDGIHLSPVFQRGINFIWTADRQGTDRVWVAYFFDGFIVGESLQFNAWTRAVRSVRPSVEAGIR